MKSFILFGHSTPLDEFLLRRTYLVPTSQTLTARSEFRTPQLVAGCTTKKKNVGSYVFYAYSKL